jgi:hypothetical protein
MQPSSMNIKSVSPLRINLESLIVITQVSWNATNISNQKTVFINSFFYFVILELTVHPSWTSTWINMQPLTIINMDLLRFFVLWKKLQSSSHLNCHPIFWIT